MKDEITDNVLKKFAGLKQQMYSIFVDDNNEHKNGKSV